MYASPLETVITNQPKNLFISLPIPSKHTHTHTHTPMIILPQHSPSFPLNSNRHHQFRRHIRQFPATSRYRRSPNLSPRASAGVDAFTKKSGYLFELSNSEADSLTEYNISKIRTIYRNKPLVVLRRLFQIGTSLGKWILLRYFDSVTERAEEMFEVQFRCNYFMTFCFITK